MRLSLITFLLLLLTACAAQQQKLAPEKITLTPTSVSDLDGWQNDAPKDALVAFRKSCTQLTAKPATTSLGVAGIASAWHSVCDTANQTPDTDAAAHAFFEQNFTPYVASGNEGSEGLFTGYYVPELNGSLQRGGAFQTPLYARPNDLISVDLGAFKSDLKGQKIVGKVSGQNLVPYDDRAAITKNTLDNRAQVLVWVDDPIDAFFLEVQGSGSIRLRDGSVMTVGYDGANGRAYVAIGRVMAERGDIPRPVTMPAIRAWLTAHPRQAQQIMNENPSYIFFRRLPDTNVVGAEGVALTPQRSLAVDPAFVPLGLPIWLDTTDGQGAPIQRLVIAQDTGGAIKGPVRGDFFWGAGATAASQAGAMQSRGHYYLLLPKAVSLHDD